MRSTIKIDTSCVTKMYHNPRLFHKELASYMLLDHIGLSGAITPKLLTYSETALTITTTRVHGHELANLWFSLSKEESAAYHQHIAQILSQIHGRTRALEPSLLGPHAKYLDWELFIEDVLLVAEMRANRTPNTAHRGAVLSAIELVRSKRDYLSKRPRTWLHRDLVQTNIMVTGSRPNEAKLIDFEHALIGPIEFEFANEAFLGDRWAPVDNKYLYAGHIKSLLCIKHGIHYDFSLDILMAIIYGLEHFGYGARVGTYGVYRCAQVIHDKLALWNLAEATPTRPPAALAPAD